jgi:hypothetical protein
MKEAFVHIGAHKAASSFLRANLNLHKDRLMEEHGLGLVTRAALMPSAFGEEIYEVSQGRHPETDVTDAAKESLRSLLPDGDDNVLISNEDLICHLQIQDFYQNAERAIRYLRTALCAFDLHVIFYIRKQADYLESIYMQFVHLGRRVKFAKFLERAAPVDLSWLRAVEDMERALPPGRLHLRTYEQIRLLGEIGFYRDFLSLCRVTGVEDFTINEQYAKGRPANRSYGQLGMQIAQRVNPLLSRKKEKKVLRRFLQEHFSTATHPRAVLLNEEQRKAIFETYRESNRRLFERYDLGVDGERLGYF